MSYAIYDDKGYVGDLCSNNGLNELTKASKGTPVAPLFEDGVIELDDDVKKEIAGIKEPALDNLKELISKSKLFAVLSDGAF
jgi:hypothetical protein